MRRFFLGSYFFNTFLYKDKTTIYKNFSFEKRRYLKENPKKIVASAETSADELEGGQDTEEEEVIHVTMKYIKLFNKGSHKIVQNETESFLKKDQV